jgi:hypothetical protein
VSRPTPRSHRLSCSLVYFCTLALLEKRDFWVVGNANKFLQTEAILKNDYSDYSIPWSGQTMDPDFVYNPIPVPFSKVHEGKLYSTMPPFFALVSSFFFRAFGFSGLYILPFFCSLATFWGIRLTTGNRPASRVRSPGASVKSPPLRYRG